MAGALIEGTDLGAAMLRAIDRVTRFVRENTETMFRAGTAFFFISIWAFGGILLTPELKTNSTVIAAIQLGIAAGMLSRRTMPLSAAGIAVIFAVAVWEYGVFHLADYPIFLGVAAYLALDRIAARLLRRQGAGHRALERRRHADVGVDREMGLSGVVVSAVRRASQHDAWALPRISSCAPPAPSNSRWHSRLMWTPLVRRVAAIMLSAMFISAVFAFGKVDLIGHTLIVVVLFAIIADDRVQAPELRHQWLIPVRLCGVAGGIPDQLLRGARAAVRHVADLSGRRAGYWTWTVSFIFGWMAHSTSKVPATGKVTLVLLPGSWSPESNLNLSEST